MKRTLTTLLSKASSPLKSTSLPPISTFLKPPTLLTSESLQQEHLQKLFSHQITALQIKDFYPSLHAQALGKELSDVALQGGIDNWRIQTNKGLEVSDVWTMGEYVPYNVAVATNRTEEYFQGVAKDFRKRRLGFPSNARTHTHTHTHSSNESNGSNGSNAIHEYPRLWPLDQLRLELDEIWKDGAGLARDGQKRPQGGGLPRIMMGPTRWKKGFIHADQFAPLSKNQGLFSANIYLQLPHRKEEGKEQAEEASSDMTELHIWDLNIYSHHDWSHYEQLLRGLTMQDAQIQMKLRRELGEPLKIHIDPGDLVLLCVQKPHAACFTFK